MAESDAIHALTGACYPLPTSQALQPSSGGLDLEAAELLATIQRGSGPSEQSFEPLINIKRSYPFEPFSARKRFAFANPRMRAHHRLAEVAPI